MLGRRSRTRFPIETVVLMTVLLWATADRAATRAFVDPANWFSLGDARPVDAGPSPFVVPAGLPGVAASQPAAPTEARLGVCAADDDGVSELDLTL